MTKKEKNNPIETIEYIKKVLHAPFYYITRNAKNVLSNLHFEDEQGTHWNFTGYNLMACIQEAKDYVENEIAAGVFKSVNETTKDDTETKETKTKK
jgi:hypothetical protein